MNNTINDIEKLIENNERIRLSDIPQEQIEKGKEYISKADLSQIVFNGKAIPFADIDNPIELVQYLTSKSKINDLSEKYVSHYTNYDTAKKIIGTRKFHLGNPSNMNDGLEFSSTSMDCSKVYFSSFSIERSENIGMWSMYGQPWEKGIKISIPKKAFMSWTEQMSEIFEVNTISSENDFNKPIDSRYFKPSIARVAYVELDKDGNVNQIRCGDNAKNNKIKSVNSKILSGYIKDDAWSYEKEIRLRVDLQDKTNAKRIAVNIPDNIMKSIIITTGPRFDKQIIDNDFLGIAKVNRSIFTGKLTYVYCDECRSRVV